MGQMDVVENFKGLECYLSGRIEGRMAYLFNGELLKPVKM